MQSRWGWLLASLLTLYLPYAALGSDRTVFARAFNLHAPGVLRRTAVLSVLLGITFPLLSVAIAWLVLGAGALEAWFTADNYHGGLGVLWPVFWIMSSAIACTFEEVVFRGMLFGGLWHRFGVVPGAVLSSLLCALPYLLVQRRRPALADAGIEVTWLQAFGLLVPVLYMDLLLCYLVVKTRSLYPAWACHFTMNISSILLTYLVFLR